MTQPTHGLIDGDIIVYRVGFASEDVDQSICKARVDSFINDLMIGAEVITAQGWITTAVSQLNFRSQIAKTLPYKGNRTASKPKYYDFIRSYLCSIGFKIAINNEADDEISIEASQNRDEVVICSIDKDLRQVPGWHYNFVTKKMDYVEDEEGNRNFYTQILTGDRVDNIPGVGGIGPVKAEKILRECTTDYQMYMAVLSTYFDKLDDVDKAREAVLERGQLLWMQREPNQIWTPPK
jgi:hypothetical protein